MQRESGSREVTTNCWPATPGVESPLWKIKRDLQSRGCCPISRWTTPSACATVPPNNVAQFDFVNSVPFLLQIVVTRNVARETTTLRRQEDAPELKGPLRPEIARLGEKKA